MMTMAVTLHNTTLKALKVVEARTGTAMLVARDYRLNFFEVTLLSDDHMDYAG